MCLYTQNYGYLYGYLKVSDFEICVQTTIQTDGINRDIDAIPNCANGLASGSKYTVQAPGKITIW